ncbi:heavy-metal-associated domain-containing protein [Parasphingorhabdus pacifica]
MSTQSFTVEGMTCGHCATSVREELSEAPGVQDVQVTVETGEVVVSGDQPLSKEAATAAITEAGFAISHWPETN